MVEKVQLIWLEADLVSWLSDIHFPNTVTATHWMTPSGTARKMMRAAVENAGYRICYAPVNVTALILAIYEEDNSKRFS